MHQGLILNFAGGFNGQLFFFLMANIGTTIAPWILFFQQSAVVDKGMLEKDISWGRFDTLLGSIITVVVAVIHRYRGRRRYRVSNIPHGSGLLHK